MSYLHLPPSQRIRIENWVRAGYPMETCGVLIGRHNGAGLEVLDVAAIRNIQEDRAEDRFELDPQEFLKADQVAREAELELVGIWHSHPNHPARPSATDREFAWAGWSYLILSVRRDGVWDVRSWRLEQDDFVEQIIQS